MTTQTSRKTLLEVEDLRKSFGSLEVLKGLDVAIREGEVVTVIGPSGSGKSTFLRCLNKLEEPTSGRIVFEGQDLTDPKTDIDVVRQRIGMVFQHFNLFPHMTAAENIMLAPVQLKRMSKAEAREKALELLTRVQLSDKADSRPAQLSGGQKQRVAIARAFLANPRVLLLDEATSNLDSESEALIQKGLEALLPGRTTFVIAHRLSTVRSCRQILVLDKGEVIERGTYEDLLRLGGRYAAMLEQQMMGPAT